MVIIVDANISVTSESVIFSSFSISIIFSVVSNIFSWFIVLGFLEYLRGY